MVILMGLLTWALAACGSGGSGSKTEVASANLEAAISAVPNVETVRARYSVNAGMGSTVSVLITAVSGTESLETVMTDSLTAFAGASEGIKSSSSVSFQVTEAGQENTINPLAVGLQQSPSVKEIRQYAASGTDG